MIMMIMMTIIGPKHLKTMNVLTDPKFFIAVNTRITPESRAKVLCAVEEILKPQVAYY